MPESRDGFIARLRARRADSGAAFEPLAFGVHHFSHVVVVEDGIWRIRRLTLDPAKADAHRAAHGVFMPEHAEMLSEPGPEIVLEADSLEALITTLRSVPWPLA